MNARSQRTPTTPAGPPGGPKTRLQAWLDANGFTSAELETAAGMSRQVVGRIRAGGDVRRKTMLRLLRGCRKLAQRTILMEEIFDLDPDSPANREA